MRALKKHKKARKEGNELGERSELRATKFMSKVRNDGTDIMAWWSPGGSGAQPPSGSRKRINHSTLPLVYHFNNVLQYTQLIH